MTKNKSPLLIVFFILLRSFTFSSPLYSPTWGFTVDLPESYVYAGGDGKNRFSFENPEGAKFDIIVYHAGEDGRAPFASPEALASDVGRRLNNKGDSDLFEYRHKKAFLMELSFSVQDRAMSGWALGMELPCPGQPLLLAMAYGPAGKEELQTLHFSGLDSLAPEERDKWAPGPITEFAYPRETLEKITVFGLDINALVYREDAEASRALIEREFQVLRRHENSADWKEAWSRYYRAIYRDSFDRLADAAFQIERRLNIPHREDRDFADQVLRWVQTFKYERDFSGSDFQNPITAAAEGRGDCDSRAMLWAVILKQANITSAIMVSRHYGHALGLADIPGQGARFEVGGQKLLVAETTAKVSIGLIGETVSDAEHWLGIEFY